MPRLSVAAADATRCSAVVQPLVKCGSQWQANSVKAPPVLVPVASLGRNVVMGIRLNTVTLSAAAGGPALSRASLTVELFAASVMISSNAKDLMDMKIVELKAELEARGEGRTGNKAWLRRSLYAAIVRAHPCRGR